MTNCVLCKDDLKPEEGQLIWRGDDCRVILVNDSDLPGFCRVIWNRHVAEMTDLSYGERDHLMTLVFAVEEAIRHVMHPDKVNIAALGNMVPHLHWHVIPRFKDDAFFPGSAWSKKTQETPPATLEARRKKRKNYQGQLKLQLLVFLNISMYKLIFVSLIFAINVLQGSAAYAADIQVITSGAFAEALKDLAPEYERQSPNKIVISYGSSMGAAPDSIPSRLAKGERFDVLILAAPALDGFIKTGTVQSGTKVDLVASVMGAVVKAGAPKPDISTMVGLKSALLNAKSVAYSASASGVYLSTELFPKMGISEQMDKTARKIYSERVASVVARGEAELGFQQVSELLPIPGVDFIGELPPEAQKTVLFSAGITSNAENVAASKDLIAFLASPKATPVIQKAGLKPVLPNISW